MKKIIIAAALVMNISAFCQYCEYNVDFKENKSSFTLSVETSQDQPTMGSLVITDLRITKPEDIMPGVISMNLSLDPNAAHLPAFGPQSGSFMFFKGNQLPQIEDGQYEIVINGISCGHMLIDQKNGGYYPLEKSFK